jgi:hypothetical protein
MKKHFPFGVLNKGPQVLLSSNIPWNIKIDFFVNSIGVQILDDLGNLLI